MKPDSKQVTNLGNIDRYAIRPRMPWLLVLSWLCDQERHRLGHIQEEPATNRRWDSRSGTIEGRGFQTQAFTNSSRSHSLTHTSGFWIRPCFTCWLMRRWGVWWARCLDSSLGWMTRCLHRSDPGYRRHCLVCQHWNIFVDSGSPSRGVQWYRLDSNTWELGSEAHRQLHHDTMSILPELNIACHSNTTWWFRAVSLVVNASGSGAHVVNWTIENGRWATQVLIWVQAGCSPRAPVQLRRLRPPNAHRTQFELDQKVSLSLPKATTGRLLSASLAQLNARRAHWRRCSLGGVPHRHNTTLAS